MLTNENTLYFISIEDLINGKNVAKNLKITNVKDVISKFN